MAIKALFVGINTYPDAPLRGCINDIENMRKLVTARHSVPSQNIKVLRDAEATGAGIVAALEWLAAPEPDETSPVRLFHYSGHGSYVVDRNGDEPDGRDEAVVPYDFRSKGMLTDDVLHQLYARFGRKTHLLLTMDCCHSGTITRNLDDDVVYRFLPNTPAEEQAFEEAKQTTQARKLAFVTEQMRALRDTPVADDEFERRVLAVVGAYEKKHFGVDRLSGNTVLIAACRSDQTAADAHIGGSYNGAFSYYLAEVLSEMGANAGYADLIREVGKRLYAGQYEQVPQLECRVGNRACAFLQPAA
jgi:hypothetical protein